MSIEMQRSWLVQRLQKPLGGTSILGPDNVFAFGGGMRNGGLSDEAMALLREVFSFDYMGAAEFEFGAVPKALDGLAEAGADLAAGSFAIALADVAPNWRDRKAAAPDGEATVYYLGRSGHVNEIETRVRGWAADPYKARLKEMTHIDSTLRPYNDFDGRTVGWLELDNGFLFFTDREMWAQTAALFGVEVQVTS